MGQPSVQQVLNDPEFHALPVNEQQKVLSQIDSDYAGLPTSEQMKVLASFNGQSKPDFAANPPGVPNPRNAVLPMPTTPQEKRKAEFDWALNNVGADRFDRSMKTAAYVIPGMAANKIAAGIGGKVLNTLLKAGVEGAGTGAVTALEGGNAHDVKVNSAIGASGPIVGGVLSPLGKWLKGKAFEQYAQVFNPTRVDTKEMTKRVVPQLLEQNKIALTRDSLKAAADKNMANIGRQLDAAYAAKGNPMVDTKQIIKNIDDLQVAKTVHGVSFNDAAVQNLGAQANKIAQLGSQVPLDDLRTVRQILDGAVADARGHYKAVSDATLISAQKAAADSIRSELAKQYPDVAKLNAKFNLWSNVYDVLDATASRKVGQWGRLRQLIAAAGMGGGAYAHGGFVEAAGAAGVTAALTEAVNSTAWKTTSAVLKNQLADAMMSGNFAKATAILSGVAAGARKRQ